jgi:hypothetical protein
MVKLPVANSRRMLSAVSLILAATLAGGCGLGDYEALLREQQARAKAIEDERKLLGTPLDLPAVKMGDTTVSVLTEANVFLRPPKSFKCNPAPALVNKDKFSPPPSNQNVPHLAKEKGDKMTELYGYEGGENSHILLAAAVSDNLNPSEAERTGEANEFKRSVWACFLNYIRWPKDRAMPEPTKKTQEELLPPRIGKQAPPPLRFDVWTWEDQQTDYFIYFYRNEGAQPEYVAVIFQFPAAKANDPLFLKEIDASLKSLAVGPLGAARRYEATKTR